MISAQFCTGCDHFSKHFLTSTINEFQECVFGGKRPLVFGVFANLSVEAFNDIGRVNDASECLWILEVLAKISQLSFHDRSTAGYFLPHFSPSSRSDVPPNLYLEPR